MADKDRKERMRHKGGMENEREKERAQDNRLFQAPMQEQTQQPTLPQSIRVMEREEGREHRRLEREREGWAEGGVRETESHVDEPICLIGHQKGREVA